MKRIMTVFLSVVLFAIICPAQENSVKNPKYVFFMIGDGMSLTQVSVAEAYLHQVSDGPDEEGNTGITRLNMTQMPVVGFQSTFASDQLITDSAAAATAMACGKKTSCGTLGMDSAHSVSLPSLAEKARDKGMKVGLLTTVSIDHATPAGFYAHVASRDFYWQISMALAASNFDFFGGGGMKGEKVVKGKRSLQPGKPKATADNDPVEQARKNGYAITINQAELQAVMPGTKVFAYSKNYLNGDYFMPYSIDKPADDMSLAQYTEQAVRLLDNDKGFFLMVEGGKIDQSCHANDARTTIEEVIAFDKAVAVALKFYHKHPDETLIVVTGDHETGALAMGYAGTAYNVAFETLAGQKMSYERFNDTVWKEYKKTAKWQSVDNNMDDALKGLLKDSFGLDYDELTNYEKELIEKAYDESMDGIANKSQNASLHYGTYEPLTVSATHLLNRRAGISWGSFAHTAVPVPVYAVGCQSNLFESMYDNTDTAKKIATAMQIELK